MVAETLVIIPLGSVVTWECVRVPKETPSGVTDGSVMRVSFDGRRFDVFEDVFTGEGVPAIDLDDGSVVRLTREGRPW